MRSSARQHRASTVAGAWGPPAGLRILVPGLPQWSWRQRGRALVLLGAYLSALGVGLFAWGMPVSFAMLAFAFASHVASAADVVRQRAFPGFGRWVPVISASAGLGLGYAPIVGSLWMIAWPGEQADAPGKGYLVNRWAYRSAQPDAGDWVWYNPPTGARHRVARVLAREGQEAEWSEGRLRVDGRPVDLPASARASDVRWTQLLLKVPAGYLLMAPTDNEPGDPGRPSPMLVEISCVRGRVWAQHAPIWDRRFLP